MVIRLGASAKSLEAILRSSTCAYDVLEDGAKAGLRVVLGIFKGIWSQKRTKNGDFLINLFDHGSVISDSRG